MLMNWWVWCVWVNISGRHACVWRSLPVSSFLFIFSLAVPRSVLFLCSLCLASPCLVSLQCVCVCVSAFFFLLFFGEKSWMLVKHEPFKCHQTQCTGDGPLRLMYTAPAHVPSGHFCRVPVPSLQVLWTQTLFHLMCWMFEPVIFTEGRKKSLFGVEKATNHWMFVFSFSFRPKAHSDLSGATSESSCVVSSCQILCIPPSSWRAVSWFGSFRGNSLTFWQFWQLTFISVR